MYEIEHGSSLTSLIEAAGGLTDEVRAILVGGYAGSWIDAPTSPRLRSATMTSLGRPWPARVSCWCPATSCLRPRRDRARDPLAGQESAGQCGPCIHGLEGLAAHLEGALTGRRHPTPTTAAGSHTSCPWCAGGAPVSHPDGTVRFVGSAVEVFAPELPDHMQHGPCPPAARAA